MSYDFFAYLILCLFYCRRWLFLLVACLKKREGHPANQNHYCPAVLILVPFRNEAVNLGELVAHLNRLDYPAGSQTVLFIDDGSTDNGQDTIPKRDNWHTLRLPVNMGKAAALQIALEQFPAGELIIVYDADERPQPESLRRLVQPFQDERVGWVTGRRKISNPLASAIATYATYENLIHQHITLTAKDSLALAPPSLGSNCAYRRTALGDGFRPGMWLEDSDLSLRMAQAGWKSHFVPTAISQHTAPQSISGYWRQHRRWAKGFSQLTNRQLRDSWQNHQLSWPLRLELLLFAAGYLDRLAMLGAMVGLVWRWVTGRAWRFAFAFLLSLLLTPLLQAMIALKLEKAPAGLWWRFIYLPLFLPLDMAMAVTTLLYGRVQWEARERTD